MTTETRHYVVHFLSYLHGDNGETTEHTESLLVAAPTAEEAERRADLQLKLTLGPGRYIIRGAKPSVEPDT